MSANQLSSPYKGLVPYDETDSRFFFGRAAETEIIIANLIASRLTLLYGASGVGKSSVLRAGVVHSLRELAKDNLARQGTPEFLVVDFSSWRDDPVTALQARIQEVVDGLFGPNHFKPAAPTRSLKDFLKSWTAQIGGDILVLFDQFEEYFLYHGHEQGPGTFADEFPRAVNQRDLAANFLISIREDELARLDYFKGRIPNLFDNYLRIQHLNSDAARDAILKPIETFNASLPEAQRISIEPELVDQVLAQLEEGKVRLGEGGRGTIQSGSSDVGESRIETPFLQLVMTRLWDEEVRAKSLALRLETLNRLGGAERIVLTHLDEAMSALPAKERDIAASLFRFLVTPSGTKIAYSASDIAAYVLLPEAQVSVVLQELAGQIRILRPIASVGDDQPVRYEIFHDVLAGAILDWRQRYVQAKERALQAERGRRLRTVGAVIGIIALLVIGLLGFNVIQAQSALTQSNDANRNLAFAVLTESASLDDASADSGATRNPASGGVATAAAYLTETGHKGSQQPEASTPEPKSPKPTKTPKSLPDVLKTADAYYTLVSTPRTETPTASYTPTSTAVATTTPIAPPGVYVNRIRVDPPRPSPNSDMSFYVTFFNNSGSDLQVRWRVEIYRVGETRSLGSVDGIRNLIPQGTTEMGMNQPYRVGNDGVCRDFQARVGIFDQGSLTPLKSRDGTDYWFKFQVCP
jgi:hypothetical protein